MSRPGQSQDNGDGSINYQAGKDIHVHGLSIDDARKVAIDVFRSNAVELAGVAQALAISRAEDLTNEFLTKLESEMPEHISQLADPDVQSVLFNAQREFSRSGENDLRTALVDLLAARAGEQERSLRLLALNEAITSAPKLTEKQRRAIAWIFYMRYTRPLNLGTPDDYYARLEREVLALGVDVPAGRADYQHIEYVGAGSLSVTSSNFARLIMAGVEGLFTNGFEESDVESSLLNELHRCNFLIPALRDPSRFQLPLLADEDLENRATEVGLVERIPDLNNLIIRGRMTETEVSDEVVSRVPILGTLRDIWDDEKTGLRSMTLTSVGLALGHAYWVRLTGSSSPLQIWLP